MQGTGVHALSGEQLQLLSLRGCPGRDKGCGNCGALLRCLSAAVGITVVGAAPVTTGSKQCWSGAVTCATDADPLKPPGRTAVTVSAVGPEALGEVGGLAEEPLQEAACKHPGVATDVTAATTGPPTAAGGIAIGGTTDDTELVAPGVEADGADCVSPVPSTGVRAPWAAVCGTLLFQSPAGTGACVSAGTPPRADTFAIWLALPLICAGDSNFARVAAVWPLCEPTMPSVVPSM